MTKFKDFSLDFVWVVRLCAITIFYSFASSGYSQDPLTNWNDVFDGPSMVNGIAYGNGTFIGVGGGFRYISHDGADWIAYASPPILSQAGIAYGNETFLTFGTNFQNKTIIYQSTNGLSWMPIYTNKNALFAAAYGNHTWVFIGENEILAATLNSSNWTWTEFQPTFNPAFLTYGNGIFALQSDFGVMFSSPDGIAWQYQSANFQLGPARAFGYGNGKFLTVCEGYEYYSNLDHYGVSIYSSSNLNSWTNCFIQTTTNYDNLLQAALAFGGNHFILDVLFYNNSSPSELYSSSDGFSWSSEDSDNFFEVLSFGQSAFVGNSGYSFYQSGAISAETNMPSANLAIVAFAGITVNGIAGAVYQIQFATSLNENWIAVTNFVLPYSPYLWIDTSTPIIGQRFYRSVQIQ